MSASASGPIGRSCIRATARCRRLAAGGERDRQKFSGAAAVDAGVRPAPAVFDQTRIDMAVLDHHGVDRARSCRPCRRRGGGCRDRRGTPNIARRWAPPRACRRRRRRCVRAMRRMGCATAKNPPPPRAPRRRRGNYAGRPVGDRLAAAETAMRSRSLSSPARSPTRCVNALRSSWPGR